VNSDAFVDPGFLAPLVDALAADPGLGAACPKILFADRYRWMDTVGDRLDVDGPVVLGDGWMQPDDLVDPRPVATAPTGRVLVPGGDLDVINNVGNELTPERYGVDRGFGEVDTGQYDGPEDVFGWCGAAVLFPSSYLQQVGGFDERLFLYYEDLDLAWRGRARGWRYRTVPASVVRHRLGATSRVGSPIFRYHTERNRLVVLAKHEPTRVWVAAALRHLKATASYARRDLVRRRPAPQLVWLRLRSWFGFVRLLPHALTHRDPGLR
jgi:GT2 family glycosyltransferase